MKFNSNFWKRSFLYCGIMSSLWYIFLNIYIPTLDPHYSPVTQTVSELSAIGAPTRQLWVLLAIGYPILFALFGWGVMEASHDRKLLRAAGWVMIVYAIFSSYWPPMHQRGMVPTLTDTLHITWTMVTVVLMLVIMGFTAASLGRAFKVYSITSMVLQLLFGILTSLDAPHIPSGEPTPLIGIWERINIAIFMMWVIVLAGFLLQERTLKQ